MGEYPLEGMVRGSPEPFPPLPSIPLEGHSSGK